MREEVQLGDIVRFRKGKKAVDVHEHRVEGSKPYIQIDEVRGVTPANFASDPKGVEVVRDDLCIVWDGANAGTVGYGIEGLIGSTVARMRLVASDQWETRFIGRLLQSRFQELNEQAQARGATIPHVDKAKLNAIALPSVLPNEQRRIATILERADAILRKREQVLLMADKLIQSAFKQIFGHPLDPDTSLEASTLGKQCDFFAGNSLPSGIEFQGQERGLFLLKVSDLNSVGNETLITTAKLWMSSRAEATGCVIAPTGAVVFPKRGGAIATNKKRVLGRDSVLDPNLMAVSPKTDSGTSLPYLRTWFELIDLRSISSGSSVPQLNKRDLGPLPCGIPAKRELNKFNEISISMDRLKCKLRFSEGNAVNMLRSLSIRAFHGNL